jgi:hypothetical protein
MRFPLLVACTVLVCPVFTFAAEPAGDAGSTAVPEPHVQHTVIEDDANRIEELNVRGQTRSVVVTTKGALGGTYEIYIGDPSRDLSDTAGSRRGATGQRVWRVLSF